MYTSIGSGRFFKESSILLQAIQFSILVVVKIKYILS